MKKNKIIFYGKILLMLAALAIAVFVLVKATNKVNAGGKSESLEQLDSTIRKATITCYATEGVFPPTIDYLEKNYGVLIDKEKYTVFYEIFGENVMPEITVMERQ